jgi:hypothetical protein
LSCGRRATAAARDTAPGPRHTEIDDALARKICKDLGSRSRILRAYQLRAYQKGESVSKKFAAILAASTATILAASTAAILGVPLVAATLADPVYFQDTFDREADTFVPPWASVIQQASDRITTYSTVIIPTVWGYAPTW